MGTLRSSHSQQLVSTHTPAIISQDNINSFNLTNNNNHNNNKSNSNSVHQNISHDTQNSQSSMSGSQTSTIKHNTNNMNLPKPNILSKKKKRRGKKKIHNISEANADKHNEIDEKSISTQNNASKTSNSNTTLNSNTILTTNAVGVDSIQTNINTESNANDSSPSTIQESTKHDRLLPNNHIIKQNAKSADLIVPFQKSLDPPITIKTTKSTNLSPRKQAIMRYKKSDEFLSERSYIAEAKENLKASNRSPVSMAIHESPDKPIVRANLNMDEKVTLFKYKSSKIIVVDEQHNESNSNSSSGRLLGHGEFEVFQLHNGDVTYLSCGPSFIYPLFSKQKLLRIGFNQFILPLVNPERYWKIFINSDEPNVIEVLESSFERVVKYRNLYFKSKETETPRVGHYPIESSPPSNINDQPHELKSLSIIDESDANNSNSTPVLPTLEECQFPSISNVLPESPPSAPISPPHGYPEISLDFNMSPSKKSSFPDWSLSKKTSNHSFSTSIACLDLNGKLNKTVPEKTESRRYTQPNIHQPIPKQLGGQPQHHSNPYVLAHSHQKSADHKSDSSMDSLLDEYEENINTTKSITFTRSRPPSRQHSVTSNSLAKLPNYNRGAYFHGPIDVDEKSSHGGGDIEDFPTTSLSEYNRIHQENTRPEVSRSRRSTRSELYATESNWMEPNIDYSKTVGRIPKSRSNYSISSAQSVDLNSTYKNIYRTITQRNSKQFVDDDTKSSKSQRLPTITAHVRSDFTHPTPTSRNNLSHRSSYANSIKSERTTSRNSANTSANTSSNNVDLKLDSTEIYKLISSRRPVNSVNANTNGLREVRNTPIPKSTSFASRLFGW
ncbi:Phosphatidylinositol-4-phosphate 5-kinase and related FYVE finger-containing proteins Signal transduction mechanisms [Scheffersomyces stipitis CBS 6054]|uniref:Inheritance of peroxisomes protein 1 n=1 Tax=Scheffersomyces stipitis (strain ATCC 58785 / CBS 6054 / NBRC 10063 / NRRL Y-11545) TaxID=322104 RepID=A3LPD1_PICST|nr:Phosphatidylinositol-4-phosphate 5-kinase and related FYVE finger-containing proteins Signal transduction mechanisms [Scheffersomyces stipitis CBS 6054]ABN65023.2 Phosphatidylinositol-4-phosphate 5-kinase and related FYVE finger-containing proteins Signal transduction mechanisms [Scheffersomyces stipitis CBS 6054]